MNWADKYIEQLLQGEIVQFRPRGNSMKGKVESGELCTVAPIQDYSKLEVGNIVLCKVKGSQYLHLVSAIDQQGRFQISNNKNHINGWISSNAIYGICTKVEK